ncbi:hypothetical protein BH23GEM9_BH23GEM9_14450 [soil metagenome]
MQWHASRPVRAGLNTAAVLVLAGCGDRILGVEEVAGVYDVVSVNGEPLPITTAMDTARSGVTRLTASSMVFRSDSSVTWAAEYEYSSPAIVNRWTETSPHFFRVVGREVRLHLFEITCCYALVERAGNRLVFTLNGDVWTLQKR